MDLRQLEIVQAVAETGSFTGAGHKLHVSQSAISRQVLLLEDELNESLFVRSGRRVRITPTGDALVRLSQRLFNDIKETVNLLSDRQQVLTGTLRLAGGMTHGLYVFPALFKEYQRRHPHVEIKVISDAAPVLIRALKTGAADLGLLTLPLEEPELDVVPVMREEMLLVTHPADPLAKKKRITPQDLTRQRFVLFETASSSRRIIDEFFAREQVDPVIVMETQNVEILKALVRIGMGMTIIPYQAVARELRSGQFFCARIAGTELVRQTGWVYPRTNHVPRMIDEMFQTFRTIMPRLKLSPPGHPH